jgi:hypothetical protein
MLDASWLATKFFQLQVGLQLSFFSVASGNATKKCSRLLDLLRDLVNDKLQLKLENVKR